MLRQPWVSQLGGVIFAARRVTNPVTDQHATMPAQRPILFGPFGVVAAIGAGRFGPVYRAEAPDGKQPLVVRTFAGLPPPQGMALLDALAWLCDMPLDHASIARPLACGVEGNVPYLVHALVQGVPLDEYVRREGVPSVSELMRSVTQAAAAIDFAAAVGVHHGALGQRDIIVGPEVTGVTGFGVIQAVMRAGIAIDGGESAPPTQAGDLRALTAVAFDLLERDARPVTALRFAEALHAGTRGPVPASPEVNVELASDLPLRPVEEGAAARGPAFEATQRQPSAYTRVPMFVALVISLALGAAAGLTRGGDDLPLPGPPATAAVVPSPARIAPAGAIPALETPPPSSSAAGPRQRATPRAPASTARVQPGSQARSGALYIGSRPAGARVFLNGRAAGATPVLVSGLAAGTHHVRLELQGHGAWSTSVVVSAGAQTRVGASLEP